MPAIKEAIELNWEIGKALYEKKGIQGWENSVVDNPEKYLIAESLI